MADWTRVDFAQAPAPVVLPEFAVREPEYEEPIRRRGRPPGVGNKRLGLHNKFDKKTNAERSATAAAKRKANGLLIKPGGLQRGEHPCTSEVDYSADETEFMLAIEKYKREHRRPFPTNREILRVFLTLGYRKVAEKTQGGVCDAQSHEGPDQEEALGVHPARVRG